jgi:hypothetical protein
MIMDCSRSDSLNLGQDFVCVGTWVIACSKLVDALSDRGGKLCQNGGMEGRFGHSKDQEIVFKDVVSIKWWLVNVCKQKAGSGELETVPQLIVVDKRVGVWISLFEIGYSSFEALSSIDFKTSP